MKYKITVDHETYEVEVTDLEASPIIVFVDGEPVEILLEEEQLPTPPPDYQMSIPVPAASVPRRPSPVSQPRLNVGDESVYAPIPGVIDSIKVKAGDVVEVGQELCVLEAMKMKNIIRAVRAGTIAEINIEVGQQVAHHAVLMTYADE